MLHARMTGTRRLRKRSSAAGDKGKQVRCKAGTEFDTQPLSGMIRSGQPNGTLQCREDDKKEPVQTTLIQRKSGEEEEPVMPLLLQRQPEEEPVELKADPLLTKAAQRPVASPPPVTASPPQRPVDTQALLRSSRGGGVPMIESVRVFMEKKFNVGFADVRIHTGTDAIELCTALRAQAFTNGRHIYFNAGRYNPDTDTGRRLLAHELTHIVQQKSM